MDMVRVRVAYGLVCCVVHGWSISWSKCHASLLSSFLLENLLYFDVNEIFSFQKLVEKLTKMTVANLGRQHQRPLESYFKSFLRIFVFVWSYNISYYFIPCILLKLVVCILNSYYLYVRILSIIRQAYAICHINEKTTPW